jgi:hypothetical protein
MTEPLGAVDADSSNSQSLGQKILGVLLLVVLLVLAGLVVVEIFPHHVSNAKDPSFVDNIFANQFVLMFVRVALIAAAIYVVVSVIALMGGRRWLSELGPFKVSDPIARLDSSARLLQNELQEAVDTIQELEGRLVESDETLAKAQGDIGTLLDYIDTIEAKKEGN